jgi:regulator of protease activity HflC (stomatin/prohibitin superfamily)
MAKTESPDVAAQRRARRPAARSRLRRARDFIVFVFKALILVVLFTVAIFFDRIAHGVYPGQRGVRWERFGGGTVLDRTYEEGMHLTWPWDEFYIYDIREQHFDQDTLVYARDGLEINVKTSIRFRPKSATLPMLHHEIGPDYKDKVLVPEAVSTLRKVLGNYTPEMIYSRDEEGLLAEIGDTLREDLDARYFEVLAFLVLELRLPTNIEDAIQAKLTEEQKMLSYRFRLDRERDEKQRRQIEAEGLRDFEATSGLSILRWRGIEATENLAKSANAKIILMGTGEGQLPVILNADAGTPPVMSPAPPVTAPEPAPTASGGP